MNNRSQKVKNSPNVNDVLSEIFKSQNNNNYSNKKNSTTTNLNKAVSIKQTELTNSPSKYSQPQQMLSKEEFEEVVEPQKIIQNPIQNSNKNMMLLKNLKEQIDQLESEKTKLEQEIIQLRKNAHLIKAEEYSKKVQGLEKERNEAKATATHYLNMCSQLAEEVIVLRDQLDKYSYAKKEK